MFISEKTNRRYAQLQEEGFAPSTYEEQMVRTNPLRYVFLATLSLLAAALINWISNPDTSIGNVDPATALLTLLWIYGVFHLIAASAAAVMALFLSVKTRSMIYVVLAVAGFLATLYLLPIGKHHSVHLFVVCWGSLVLISLDNFRRVNLNTKETEQIE